jgi:hypothetical protein
MRVLCPWNIIHKNGQQLRSSVCAWMFTIFGKYILHN